MTVLTHLSSVQLYFKFFPRLRQSSSSACLRARDVDEQSIPENLSIRCRTVQKPLESI
jgi:hypothetical protein